MNYLLFLFLFLILWKKRSKTVYTHKMLNKWWIGNSKILLLNKQFYLEKTCLLDNELLDFRWQVVEYWHSYILSSFILATRKCSEPAEDTHRNTHNLSKTSSVAAVASEPLLLIKGDCAFTSAPNHSWLGSINDKKTLVENMILFNAFGADAEGGAWGGFPRAAARFSLGNNWMKTINESSSGFCERFITFTDNPSKSCCDVQGWIRVMFPNECDSSSLSHISASCLMICVAHFYLYLKHAAPWLRTLLLGLSLIRFWFVQLP